MQQLNNTNFTSKIPMSTKVQQAGYKEYQGSFQIIHQSKFNKKYLASFWHYHTQHTHTHSYMDMQGDSENFL